VKVFNKSNKETKRKRYFEMNNIAMFRYNFRAAMPICESEGNLCHEMEMENGNGKTKIFEIVLNADLHFFSGYYSTFWNRLALE